MSKTMLSFMVRDREWLTGEFEAYRTPRRSSGLQRQRDAFKSRQGGR